MLEGMKGAIGGLATFTVVGVGVIAVVSGLSYAGYEINAALSGSRGAARVKSDTNSGTNQEAASGIFNQLYTQINTYEAQIKQAVAIGDTDAANLDGAGCLDAVGQYNADLNIVTMKPWVPSGLPTSIIDPSVCAIPAGGIK